jgi:hypothetical protein
MMNTPKSLDSPVVTTPASQLFGVFGISIRIGLQKKTLVTYRPGGKDSPVVNTLGSLYSPAVNIPGS